MSRVYLGKQAWHLPSCQMGVTLIPSVSHCMGQEQHYKGALPNPRWAEPQSPFPLGPPLPSTAGPQLTPLPLHPYRGLWVGVFLSLLNVKFQAKGHL